MLALNFAQKISGSKRVGTLEFRIKVESKLGSVAGPVIQTNGRMTFEDDLRSEGLLYFTPH